MFSCQELELTKVDVESREMANKTNSYHCQHSKNSKEYGEYLIWYTTTQYSQGQVTRCEIGWVGAVEPDTFPVSKVENKEGQAVEKQ